MGKQTLLFSIISPGVDIKEGKKSVLLFFIFLRNTAQRLDFGSVQVSHKSCSSGYKIRVWEV